MTIYVITGNYTKHTSNAVNWLNCTSTCIAGLLGRLSVFRREGYENYIFHGRYRTRLQACEDSPLGKRQWSFDWRRWDGQAKLDETGISLKRLQVCIDISRLIISLSRQRNN